MPWTDTTPMKERVSFMMEWLRDQSSIIGLAADYGVSRKTAHKWISRYKAGGLDALADLSRAPKSHPQATPIDVIDRLVAFKREKPHWGPRKIVHRLNLLHPDIVWPAPSTAGGILRRHGLTKSRRPRRHAPPPPRPLSIPLQPNDVWSADFKGCFNTLDHTRVDPLTIADMASRFLLNCDIMVKPTTARVLLSFEKTFRDFGLPTVIRTDNGWPFATTGLTGLSRLAVWWVRLGILPERIRPAHPEENGRHERMHRNLKEDIAHPPSPDPIAQQSSSDRFRNEFNTERPHEALGMRTPAEEYRPSQRRFPESLPSLEYPGGIQIRHVRRKGEIYWRGDYHFISESLRHEWVGLKPTNGDFWELYFGPLLLAIWDERKKQFRRIDPIPRRNVSPMSPVNL